MNALTRDQTYRLLYGSDRSLRFTQDTPVLPDVWVAYAMAPGEPQDLLLVPHKRSTAGKLAVALRRRLEGERRRQRRRSPGQPVGLAFTESTVAARLTLRELIRVALPLTGWWRAYLTPETRRNAGNALTQGWEQHLKQLFPLLLERLCHAGGPRQPGPARVTEDLAWMVRVVGTLAAAQEKPSRVDGFDIARHLDALEGLPDLEAQEQAARLCLERCAAWVEDLTLENPTGVAPLWSVARNRPAEAALWQSVQTIKADAARRVFDLSCADLTWAVIDGGIDAAHPAFSRRDAFGHLLPDTVPLARRTRIRASYDFTRLRYLLDPSGEELAARLRELAGNPDAAAQAESRALRALQERLGVSLQKAKGLRADLLAGKELDWGTLAPYLEVPHDEDQYTPPLTAHGTHVAGILAGDWRATDPDFPLRSGQDLVGVCPDLELFDLRVLDPSGGGSEFAVLGALQFVAHLNANPDLPVVHGANVSLALRHEVDSFACGRTPVCEEANRLVANGVVVVAAAGNQGYQRYLTAADSGAQTYAGYQDISITDPGNAEHVLTVGATHRQKPHTYGVSYFSSRGPTGDGRIKPDLVAPGEKVCGPCPGSQYLRMDGTSMAAPHVSGAAALLMARHHELVGQPARIKEVLCGTATDLGRERYFQGAGLVDVLRAIQSV